MHISVVICAFPEFPLIDVSRDSNTPSSEERMLLDPPFCIGLVLVDSLTVDWPLCPIPGSVFVGFSVKVWDRELWSFKSIWNPGVDLISLNISKGSRVTCPIVENFLKSLSKIPEVVWLLGSGRKMSSILCISAAMSPRLLSLRW